MNRLLLVCFALGAVVAAIALQHSDRPHNSDADVAEKRAHFARVLAELESAPSPELTDDQRARRQAVLDSLRAYAARGDFPINTDDPGFRVPYFIDRYGTRCALAYAIDESGDGDLVLDLARKDNHAFVAHIQDEPRLVAWLERNGLTVDDAAFVQVPSAMHPDQAKKFGIDQDDKDDDKPEEPAPAPEPAEDPDDDAPRSNAPPPTAGQPDTGPQGARRGGASFDFGNWELFWRVNRDAYMSLREQYHEGQPTSGTPWMPTPRSRRPKTKDVQLKLLPLLGQVGAEGGRVGGTAIMAALIATTSPDDAKPAVAAARTYLADANNSFREFLLLGLGQTRRADAVELLVAVAGDRREGREALGRTTPVPARFRTYAALGLARSESAVAAKELRELLERLEGRHEELRAAAVTSLGILFPRAEAGEREASVQLLLKELKRERWARGALTVIPAALLRSGDAEAKKEVLRRVARFRGERDVRSSAALALGTLGTELDEEIVDALVAAARRDPDLQTRRHAAIAVGELALRDGRKDVPEKMRKSLRRFYLGTLDGHFKQPGAMEWHLLSAGMFARRFPDDAHEVRERLEREATRSKARDERAAALLALGLSGDPAMRKTVRDQFETSKDVAVRGSAAEALGMLGDRASRPQLMELATNATSDDLGYRAALALGYLADATVVPKLVETLEKTRSEPIRAAVTAVLGQLGDERALDDLSRLAADRNAPSAVRERALIALGLLARESDRSWTLPIRRGASVAQATAALRPLLMLF